MATTISVANAPAVFLELATDAAADLSAPGLTVRTVSGDKAQDLDSMFAEFARALDFPSYFGGNEDAFIDLLGDLSWLPDSDGFVVVIDEPEKFLVDDEEDLQWFVTAVGRTVERWSVAMDEGEEWGRSAKSFHFVLNGRPENREVWTQRWTAAGAVLADVSVV